MMHRPSWLRLVPPLALLTCVGAIIFACSERQKEPMGPRFEVGAVGGWDLNQDNAPSPSPFTLTITSSAGYQGLWTFPTSLNVGTGLINPFLRVQNNGSEEGFNTSNGAPYDDKSGTSALPLNHVPIIKQGGVGYREFILDANENNAQGNWRLSIDIFNVWVCNDDGADQFTTFTQFENNPTNCKRVYDLGGHVGFASDALTSGSGKTLDYDILIPEQAFVDSFPTSESTCPYQGVLAPACGYWLIVRTRMGAFGTDGNGHSWAADATFEEISTVQRPVPPRLTLTKQVINDNGGTATADQWTLNATGSSGSFSGTPSPAGVTTASVGPKDVDIGVQYTLSETGGPASGYSTTGVWACTGGGTFVSPDKITLSEGQNATCTIINDDVAPTLKLEKEVVNDNGGTATADAWTLHATGSSASFSGTPSPAGGALGSVGPNDVTGGVQYTLSETDGPASGYSTTGVWACTGGGTFVSPDKVTLAVGEKVTCRIVNNDAAPQLTLEKEVVNDNGGTATADAWTLHATGSSASFSGTPSPAGGSLGSVGPNDVTGGVQYTLSETDGPASGYSTTGVWACTGGGTFVSPDKITLAVGEKVTCRIVNDDVAPQLTLEKEVVNDNGGTATADAWTLHATGSSASFSGTPSPAGGALGSVGPNDVTGGVQYTLSETDGPASGYGTTGVWACTGGGTFVSPDKVTLGVGEKVTCRIVNDDAAPQLTLEKEVVNDNGGTATADAWTLHATGSSASFSGTPSPAGGALGSVGPNDVTAGVEYTLSETDGPASGYSTTGVWACTGGGTFVSPDKITLAVGEKVTCRIVNDDVAPQLTLEKEVVNDNGGTATADAWTLHATGSSASFSGTPSPAGSALGSVGPNDVTGGVQYTLSETDGPASGYSTTGVWACTGGGTFVSPDKVTLAVGEKVTCRIVNDDVAAQLTLEKEVVNDNGGTAFADEWTLHASGTGGFDGTPAPADVLIGSVGPKDVTAGVQYTLSETGGPASGYSTTGVWNCSGGGTFVSPDKITLAVGETATCRIVNDDVAPTLTLEKQVINDNGGGAFADDWTLHATGSGGFDGTPTPADALLGSVGPHNVTGGVQYTLSETGGPASGYTTTGTWSCSGGGTFVSPDKITLAVGESATCRIVNDDVAPTLTLEKEVINDNGGGAFADDWTLHATGSGGFDGTPAPADVLIGSVGPKDVTAGVQYTLSETGGPASGYSTTGDWACTGGGTFVSPDKITLAVGETATCRIVNDDQPGTIIIKKIIKPIGASTSFQFQTTGTGYTDFSLVGGTQNSQTLNAGAYTAMELVPLGWVLTGIGGSTDPNTPYNCTVTGSGGSTGVGDLNTQTVSISLKNGDIVTCVFENTGQGVTRTQGFWATHTPLANIAWFGGTAFGHTFPGVASVSGIGDNLICGRSLDDLGKVMGAFWSAIPKTSNGTKRSSLDQARMQLLQQLIAAELNASAFGSAPSSGSFTQWETALCGTSTDAIKTAQQQAASFNSAGDNSTFTPGTSADSKFARSIANISFWDIIKP